MTRSRFISGASALLAGCAVNYLGDRLLGVQIELFHGLATFSFAWMLDMFVLPFVVGVLVAVIFGLGGKWLCYFPPLIVRLVSYIHIKDTGVPVDAALLPMGWWGFFVILTMESAAFGGIIGEVVMKGTYGRSDPEKVYKGKTDDEGDS
jgi:hypothetical protein